MNFLLVQRSRRFAARGQICFSLWLALLSGGLLPIQASMNAQLARSLQSVAVAAAVSYGVGFLALGTLLATGKGGRFDWRALRQAPRWSLLGGLFGAWYVASSAYFVTTLGTTLTLGLIVGGQAIAGLIVDHFGWLGLPQHRLSRPRQFAAGLLIVALFLLTQA